MPGDDMLTAFEEARHESLEVIVEGYREAQAEIVRPAIGTKQTPEEKLAGHKQFEADDAIGRATFAELQGRFQLDPEKPIPYRYVYRAILAKQALDGEGRNRARKQLNRNGAGDLLAGGPPEDVDELGREGPT